MIQGWLVGAQQTVAKFDQLPPAIKTRLRHTIERVGVQLQRHVKADKLSGGVLNVRTGRLRRSINLRIEEQNESIVGVVGTNVAYAAVHEYGGTVSVREHLRLIKQAFGRPLREPVYQSVRAHQATYPARSFLRAALDDMKNDIRHTLERDVKSAAKDAFK